ncbi:Bridging integrator 3-like protein [Trichoplax sp. H2]|uniref:BAR domain-containing protein n=1 Tax=Trichoplax adhaerens TaxID=10228 RepID=B3S2T1_TRIAD|nr:hypothetical protein TRIADDRAFT_58471 [Trichoplax adhaerens]EDV22674.1 hypothetical protein TRIADDRAFT_58471 [Trichoplax adhaerens]RDD41979.1 Bridging integrator 3-like protein [Trichoplax sp. H2]|eukprot:XP_002114540.1 hypothetical protein TRIADDRAFT_58471 [Trichoplax adhaerens]
MPFKLGFVLNKRYIGGDRRLDEYCNELQHVESCAKKLLKDGKKCIDVGKATMKIEEQVFDCLCDVHSCVGKSNDRLANDVDILKESLHHTAEGLIYNFRKTIAEPLHRLNSIFPHANAAIAKFDGTFKECEKLQAKVDKLIDKARSPQQDVKLEQNEKALARVKAEYEKSHEALLEDVESFCRNYREYFNASIEAYFKMQALFYDDYDRTLDSISNNFDLTAAELDDSAFDDYLKEQIRLLGSDS